MSRNRVIAWMLSLLTIALIAQAQDGNVIDFGAWLQRQEQRPAPDADAAVQARHAIRDRIVAVKESRGKLVALTRGGRWQSERRQRREALPWFVQLERTRDDNRITGRLNVVGSGLFSEGNISGRIDGSAVTGAVIDDTGSQLATFTGTHNAQGTSGTYTTTDGDEGTWSYDHDGAE
ncbi:MAG: hypothetical protein HY699_14660 [Deltaproteobacteria bacterium]|nr:hypothetical protein [Deltaproteobacteria bacterium]